MGTAMLEIPTWILSKENSDRRPIAISGILALVYVIINVFSIGGDHFVIDLNNDLTAILAVGVAVYSVVAWVRMRREKQAGMLWASFAIGWILWMVAEVCWTVASIISQEVPYPSIADIFWLAGYIPMFFALWLRIRSLPSSDHWLKRIVIGGVGAIILGATIIFVVIPTAVEYDPNQIVISLLNIIYPVFDLILLVMSTWIFFAYQKGEFGKIWFWLSLGFSLHSISDLIFSYASNQGIYYPDNHLNFISAIGVDVPYALGYASCMLAMILIRISPTLSLSRSARRSKLPFIPNTHVILFANNEDRVTGYSSNFQPVFPVDEEREEPLANLIGISQEEGQRIAAEIRGGEFLPDRRVHVKTRFGEQEATMCGLPIIPDGGEFEGYTLLVRLMMASDALDDLLTGYEKSVLDNILKRVHVKEPGEEDIKQFLTGYYSAYLEAIYNQTLKEGGGTMAEALLAKIRSVLKEHGWKTAILVPGILNTDGCPLAETQAALPLLLETAQNFSKAIIGDQDIAEELRQVDAHFDQNEHVNVGLLLKRRIA
jgi:hypothetical protein